MSDASKPSDSDKINKRYREFVDLLPLTLALAGLPPSESGRYYNEEQMETRMFTLRHAYKAAKTFARESISK